MNELKPPLDALGNELHEGDYISMVPNGQLLGKVVEVRPGGLMTAHGPLPSGARLVFDINVAGLPGVPFKSVVKIVSPGSQKLIENLLEH